MRELKMTRVVIIGGVAGGASAAARLRRLKEDYEILLLDKGPYVSFANCGLPYFVGNIIKEERSLKLVSPRRFLNWFNIDVRVNNEAISIDRDKKEVLVRDKKEMKEYALEFDFLIIATGSSPIIPPFKGLEEIPYNTIWTIPDAVKIKKFVEEEKIGKAVIVGGGFIGLEMAENLVEKGVKVKIVEMLDQVMPPLDKEMAQLIHQELILNGVCLVLEDPVESFSRNDNNKTIVITKNGREIETDLVMMAVGVRPISNLAKESGLNLTPRGHIIVNELMETSDPSIYAVGDAVQVLHYQTREPISIALAGPANKQGRIAADNIAGRKVKYKGILGASVVKVFDATIATVGLTEKQLKNTSIKYEKVYVHPNNHAGYYPGATPITLKLLFEIPSGKVLGAQAVGGQGTEKRIDVISTVIKFEGTVFDLEELELTYAPPYSSAKDPVNMAGFVASNYLRGDIHLWQWHDINEALNNNKVIIDVRTQREHEARNIKGTINIPIHEIRKRIDEISKEKPIVLYCEVGYRSYIVARILMQHGFNEIYELTGGYKMYEAATATTEEIVAACGSSDAIMEEYIKEKSSEEDDFVTVDCSGLACPGPLNAMIKSLDTLPADQKLKVYATDPGFKSSVEAYSKLNDAVKLLSLGKEEGKLVAILEKLQPTVKIVTPIKKKTRAELRGPNAHPISDISADELYKRLDTEDEPPLLLDVRTPQEYYGGHIKNTRLIPLGELLNDPEVIDEYKDKEIVTICHSGSRSMMAAQILARGGFKDIRNLTRGMMLWHRSGYPVKRGKN
ncbi:MAG: FAD-dependent oxidoreductase [Promethearchaeota archaeon]|jgi:NADPH-dependent 2,4-dienoyl-CoA reductase/sulfur reductase-like enzyme/rhodanese-related sulfurtransferase/TusA-related sulfurtransferase